MNIILQILLWILLISYVGFVIVRRIKKIRRGEYCDCCDGSCKGCHAKKEE